MLGMETPSFRRTLHTALLYALALVREFCWTLVAIVAAVLLGGALYAITPHAQLGGAPPSLMTSLYVAWMALFAEQTLTPPETWYLALLNGVYALLGFVLIGEGIVRFALLMLSREHGERWWMKVMASVFRDHVVVCGLGHFGYRVLGHLVANRVPAVAIERNPDSPFLSRAKDLGAPVLVRDMQEDQALVDAGVPHARAIIIATNDDLANLEVALDSRRLNPRIRILMRLFNQQLAPKLTSTFGLDAAFSSSALAAPTVAAMALGAHVIATHAIGGVPHVALELTVESGSALHGATVAAVEAAHGLRVLARTPQSGAVVSAPSADTVLAPGDALVVFAVAAGIPSLEAAGRAAARA